MSIKVIFFSIKLDHTKLVKIIQTAHQHFSNKEPLQIITHNEKSSEFVDDLLWKHPKESFLPHQIINEKTNELLIITNSKTSLNGAFHFFNLQPTPLDPKDEITVIYDFDDQTTKEKKQLSMKKYQYYREKEYHIEAI